MSVAAEMVEQLELADCDVTFIADFIDLLIVNLVPGQQLMNDAVMSTSSESKMGESEHVITSQQHPSELTHDYVLVEGMMHSKEANASPSDYIDSLLNATNLGGPNSSEGSDISVQLDGSSKSLSEYGVDEYRTLECGAYKGTDKLGCRHPLSNGSSNFAIFQMDQASHHSELVIGASVSITENRDVLNGELGLIEAQYEQWFRELTRMREEALEGARKKWLPDK
jgi:WNK lysine deficient protein kinase